MRLLGLLARTKLYWGLALLFLAGMALSPYTSGGSNIFVSYGNLSDILRQVSITGIVAIGMTLVILIGGIDLSVGSVMALGSVLCAMLLTQAGWTGASMLGVPALAALAFLAVFAVLRFGARGLARGRDRRIGAREDLHLAPLWGLWLPVVAGALTAALAAAWAAAQVPGKFGVMGVLLVVPCAGFFMGTLSGLIIVKGRLQPFIVTLAMMVAVLGVARLTAGQDTAVYPVYTGSNATAEFEVLRSVLFGVLPVPGLFFLVLIGIFMAMLRATTFGRYVYAIGGNEEATRLSGVNVDRVKVTVYAFSGMLAALAGVLYVAQYRQGKPDAGAGIELDAIAAVAIGGTSLMGGKGSLAGTFVGVLIFGLLSNILQLNNIDSNMQLVLKGAIIILAVLLQEGSLNLFRSRPRPAQAPARPTDAAGYAVAGGTGSTKDG